MQNICDILSSNPYPGRGIIIGRTADNRSARILYFIMGRSANSRNRIFAATEDGIETRAHDESKLEDPSLIIYHPVRVVGRTAIVTNGDQTDTIATAISEGQSFEWALRTREFEPDGPNWTPRISGRVGRDGGYRLSILKSLDGNEACCCRYFFEYDKPVAGVGHFISTYEHDGNPIPSFRGEPVAVSMEGSFDEFAENVWRSLNADNKVSLYAADIDLGGWDRTERIFNKNLGD